MKKASFALFLAIAFSELSCADESDQTFLSWYDGWGIHTIWGIGKITGSYSSATVQCGSKVVRVQPVYDTHSDIAEPTATQTREYVEAANLLLLRGLLENGNKCAFQLLPQS